MSGMDDFELEIKRDFINEALINLEETEGSFMELEVSPDPKTLLDKIFRLAHNLKGGARAVGFGQVAEFTHQLENLVQKIQRSEVPLSSPVITTLLQSNDRLADMLSELKNNLEASFDNTDLLASIQGWIDGTQVAPDPAPDTPQATIETTASSSDTSFDIDSSQSLSSEVPQEIESLVEEKKFAAPSLSDFFGDEPVQSPSASEKRVEAVQEVQVSELKPATVAGGTDLKAKQSSGDSGASGPKSSSKEPAKEVEIIRVPLDKIDKLNDFVGELIVLQSVVQSQASTEANVKLHATMRQLFKLSKDIQTLSMSLRMLPVKPLVQKLQRVVRDTANTLGKPVELTVEGEGLDIDKSVLDRLADPLIHILRNAVDHGLESPEGRAEAGKGAIGKVMLSFMNEGNSLLVEVRDDGKGINHEIVRKKAIEKKLITDNQQLSEKQIINLIFHPGFSTKAEASEISGRGVGMDVVKTNVEKVGGQVDVTTVIGKGSIFKLQIPLSLAVVDGLVVNTASLGRFVIPLSQVQETLNLKSLPVSSGQLGIGSCLQLRGVVVPLFTLDECLGSKAQVSKSEGTALIVNVNDRPVGIIVQEILRGQQIVIKPLGNGVAAQKGWVGSCVLGDGLPTLIVSPQDMLHGKINYELSEEQWGGAA